MAQARATTILGRIEAARKRREYWRGVFSEQRSSGLSHSEFCRRKSISTSRYFWWKRILRQGGDWKGTGAQRRDRRSGGRPRVPSLVPVTIRAGASATAPGSFQLFEVVLRDSRVLRVPLGFHAEELRRLVAVLEGEGC
jgi:hypothetical protein